MASTDKKQCPCCKEFLSLTAFCKDGKKSSGVKSWCKMCTTNRRNELRAEFKKSCLEYLGQFRCKICGYDKFIGALDFHHINRHDKEFTIGDSRLTKLTDEIKKELDKCVVLCANCHREVEGRVED